MDSLQEIMFDKIEIPTKTKTAFTREYNKAHPDKKAAKTVKKMKVDDEEEEEENEDEEIKELQEDIEMMDI
jgi:hypothetical protein